MSIEIVNGPLEAYWGPVGESYPAIGTTPAGNWTLIGASGSENYTEDGVSLQGEDSVEFFRALGSPYPRKAFRTSADLIVSLTMVDLTPAMLRLAFNNNTVTDDTGEDTLSLLKDLDVTEMALLVRGVGKSTLLSGSNCDFRLPRVVVAGSIDLSFVKGDAVGVELMFQYIYRSSDAAPLYAVDDTA